MERIVRHRCHCEAVRAHPRVASLALRAIHLQVAPKGSEEECGREPDGQYNLSDLLQVWSWDDTPE